jgi:site-specific DNA-cytosine methylase
MIKVLSLFDGMSCGQIALDRLGIEVEAYHASEIDKYAIQVAKANYPNTIHLGDVRDVTVREHFDLIMFGSPCQGFSFSGNRLNFDDPRSKLFFEAVRILGQTRKINPDVKFLMENVRMKKESIKIITDTLDVNPVAINSNLVSAQNRYRLYWTNLEVGSFPEDKGIKLKDIIEDSCITEPKILQYPRGVNKGGLKALNGKVPSLTSSSWQTNNHLTMDEGLTYRKLTPLECERLQTVPEGYTNHVSNTQRYKMLGNGWTIDVITHLLNELERKD